MSFYLQQEWYGLISIEYIIVPGRGKTLSLLHANNNGTDQPAHPRRLFSTFLFAAWLVSKINIENKKVQIQKRKKQQHKTYSFVKTLDNEEIRKNK